MRIRTIKPEFWESPDMAVLSEPALLLAIGLLNYCDDEGYFLANAKLIESKIFPLREPSATVPRLVAELERIGYIRLCEGSNSRTYGVVVNFRKHQRKDKWHESKIKQYWVESEQELGLILDESATVPRLFRDCSDGEQGTGNREQGKEYITSPAADGFCFDDFWKVYPKKVERKKCLEIWKRKKLSAMTPALVADIRHRLGNDCKWVKGFIPNPSTYLNGERWQDEIEPLNGASVTSDLAGYETVGAEQ